MGLKQCGAGQGSCKRYAFALKERTFVISNIATLIYVMISIGIETLRLNSGKQRLNYLTRLGRTTLAIECSLLFLFAQNPRLNAHFREEEKGEAEGGKGNSQKNKTKQNIAYIAFYMRSLTSLLINDVRPA